MDNCQNCSGSEWGNIFMPANRLAAFIKYALIAALLLVPVALSCSRTPQGESIVTTDLTIPQIDVVAPAITKTATFAMG